MDGSAFVPTRGARGYQQSNPSALCCSSLLGSLKTFEEAGGMGKLRERSVWLTNALERLLHASAFYVPISSAPTWKVVAGKTVGFTIITSSSPDDRGAQLSLLFLPSDKMRTIAEALKRKGVIGDEREPGVIRLAPAPLYSTMADVERAVKVLDEVLRGL